MDEADFNPTDPGTDMEHVVAFSRLFASQCNVYLALPLEGFRLIGERFAVLLFAMLVMANSKGSDTSPTSRTYMTRRKKAFVGASRKDLPMFITEFRDDYFEQAHTDDVLAVHLVLLRTPQTGSARRQRFKGHSAGTEDLWTPTIIGKMAAPFKWYPSCFTFPQGAL